MNISINITADSTSDRDLMDRLLGALARIPDMTTAKAVVVRQPDLPAGHPQAVPMQKVESVPAPPLDEDTKTKLAALTAKHEAAPPVEEPKRGPGRPKGSKNKPPAWEPPVPRPEGGVYGKQTAPPDDPAWQAFRDSIRDRMRVVVFTASLTGVGGKKWVASMLDRYGDGEAGKLGCVPQGNLQAMIEEAEAGPKERPFTKEELEAGRLELERQAKQPAGATP